MGISHALLKEKGSIYFILILILLSVNVGGTSSFFLPNITRAQALSPSVIVINSPTNITQPGDYELGSDLAGTQNAGYCIGIFASNVVLNGMGHTLSSNNYGRGIYVSSSTSNVAIKNINVNGYGYGIYISSSTDDSVTNGVLNNNNDGIYVNDSTNVSLAYDTISSFNNPEISVYGSNNVSIMYGNFYDHSNSNVYNIYVTNSNDAILLNNSITNNGGDGISLTNSNYTFISGNNIVWTGGSFVTGDGLSLYKSYNATIQYNNIAANHYCCISGDGVDIAYSAIITMDNNVIENFPNNGLNDEYSSYEMIYNNIIRDNGGYGIYFSGSYYVYLKANTVENNKNDGLHVYYSNNNSFIYNLISGNAGDGAYLGYSDYNNISQNYMNNNANNGLELYYSDTNNIYSNFIQKNNNYGINLYYSSNNFIYNNLFNNSNNFDISYSADYWNTSLKYGENILNGYVIGGNAWLSPNGMGFSQVMSPSPENPDICNESYVLGGKNVDYLPLKYPQEAFYSVTFTESGLPSGTQWSVTLNGTTETSQTSSITFHEPNGKYFFIVGTVIGYSVSPSSGYITVNGTNVSESIKFTQINYNVTFVESGLPAGTPWSVTLNNITKYSKTNSITFQEPVGTYSYTVGSVQGYYVSQSTGTLSVTGNVKISVKFSPIVYTVTFAESGLPAGTQWSVTLNGTIRTSSTSTIVFNESNGEYYFSVGKVKGYNATPSSGYITVNGSNVYQSIEFGKVYSITFTETGLPAGTTWSVTLNGSTESSTSSSITFYVTAGTYIYTVNSVRGYSAFPQSGSIIVVNSNIVKGVIFTPVKYSVTFTESGLPSGTQWSVTLNGTTETSANSTITFSETDGSYYYTVGSVSGYVVSPASGYIIVNGSSVSQQITFVKVYSVTFTELGLPTGTLWSVTLNGTRESSTNSSITFYELAGRYYYVVGSVPGYLISQSSGMVNVAGNMKIALIFTPVMYSLTFNESGLPSGTQWSVTLNGTALSSTSQSITFIVRAGTYHYSVGNLTGYTASPATGTVKVSSNSAVNIEFSPVLVAVTFTESGLPSGTQWSVTLNGVTKTSTGSTITFMVPLGNYTYNISALSGYKLSQTSGSLKVSSPGSAPAIPVSYSALPPPALSGSLISAAFILVAVIIAVIVALSFVKRRVSAGRSKSQDTFF